MQTSDAQQELWRQSLAALESYTPNYSVELVVPEFDALLPKNDRGEPAIYAFPWDTDDEKAIARAAALDDPTGWCEVLIRKAVSQDGNRIWHRAHKPFLEQLPHDIVRRIAWAIMLGDPNPDPERLISDPSSGS